MTDLLPLLKEWGPYGTLVILIILFLIDRLGIQNQDKEMKENHIPHIEATLDALLKIQQEQATQHAQMLDRLDNIWADVHR